MKVAKRRSDQQIAYRSQPEFEKGYGIKNAVARRGGKPEDYYETEINQGEWDAYIKANAPPDPGKEIEACTTIDDLKKILRKYL